MAPSQSEPTKRKPDLSKITLREYRAIFDKEQPQDEEDAIMAKVFGFETADEMLDQLNPKEYRVLFLEMLDQMRNPVETDEKN